MSGDPERLLSLSSTADPLERDLLASVRHVGPPDGAKAEAWRGIAGQIAVVAAVGAATGSSAAAATKASAGTLASWALSTKVAAVVAASSLALGGGYLALQRSEPARAGRPARVAPSPVITPSPAKALPPSPEPSAFAPVDEAPSRKLEPRRQDLLKAESSLLTEARSQLRSGNAAGAQASLERLQSQFPNGVLAQEREVLAIEVLYARGNVDGAKRRARAFVKAHPKSPHSAKLSRFID
jgi:TolA-binding protein